MPAHSFFNMDNWNKKQIRTHRLLRNSSDLFLLVTRTRIELVLPPWKGGVLAAWPTGLVAEVGLEPTTIRVWTERSSQLSYSAASTWILYHRTFCLSIPFLNFFAKNAKKSKIFFCLPLSLSIILHFFDKIIGRKLFVMKCSFICGIIILHIAN